MDKVIATKARGPEFKSPEPHIQLGAMAPAVRLGGDMRISWPTKVGNVSLSEVRQKPRTHIQDCHVPILTLRCVLLKSLLWRSVNTYLLFPSSPLPLKVPLTNQSSTQRTSKFKGFPTQFD